MAAVEMPQPLPVNVKTFSQLHVQNVSPVQGGFIQSIDRITPLWTAKYQTPPLLPASAQVFQAFIDGLQGAANTFLGFDPRVAKPYAYRTYAYGVKPWEASANSATINAASPSASTITITGLSTSPNAVLTVGDYVSFLHGDLWYLHRIQASVTASGGLR